MLRMGNETLQALHIQLVLILSDANGTGVGHHNKLSQSLVSIFRTIVNYDLFLRRKRNCPGSWDGFNYLFILEPIVFPWPREIHRFTTLARSLGPGCCRHVGSSGTNSSPARVDQFNFATVIAGRNIGRQKTGSILATYRGVIENRTRNLGIYRAVRCRGLRTGREARVTGCSFNGLLLQRPFDGATNNDFGHVLFGGQMSSASSFAKIASCSDT